MIPDWATKVKSKDPVFFPFTKIEDGTLSLVVNHQLKTGQQTQLTLKGFWWWQKKQIAVKIDAGSRYSAEVTLDGDRHEETVQLPVGIEILGAKVVSGEECVWASVVGPDPHNDKPGVLLQGVKVGKATVQVDFRSKNSDVRERAEIYVTVEAWLEYKPDKGIERELVPIVKGDTVRLSVLDSTYVEIRLHYWDGIKDYISICEDEKKTGLILDAKSHKDVNGYMDIPVWIEIIDLRTGDSIGRGYNFYIRLLQDEKVEI